MYIHSFMAIQWQSGNPNLSFVCLWTKASSFIWHTLIQLSGGQRYLETFRGRRARHIPPVGCADQLIGGRGFWGCGLMVPDDTLIHNDTHELLATLETEYWIYIYIYIRVCTTIHTIYMFRLHLTRLKCCLKYLNDLHALFAANWPGHSGVERRFRLRPKREHIKPRGETLVSLCLNYGLRYWFKILSYSLPNYV